jgi:translation initiation factor IF-2
LCTRAGIQDKGSALASMTDEEVAKLKEFIAGKSRPAERPAAAGPAPAQAPPKPIQPVAPRASGTLKREDYIAPAGVASRGKPAEMPPAKPTAEPRPRPAGLRPSGDGSKPVPKPAFKLPPLPAAARPPVQRVSQEPMAQKPDVKLPLDAIRSAKAGGAKPLAEHMRKHEQRQTEARARTGSGGPRGLEPGPIPPPLELGGRIRRVPSKGGGGPQSDDLLGGRDSRQLARKRSGESRGIPGDDEYGSRRRRPRQRRGSSVSTAAPRKSSAAIQVPCTVRAFSEAIGLAAGEVLKKLLGFGLEQMPSMSTMLDRDTVELLAAELGVELNVKTSKRSCSPASMPSTRTRPCGFPGPRS